MDQHASLDEHYYFVKIYWHSRSVTGVNSKTGERWSTTWEEVRYQGSQLAQRALRAVIKDEPTMKAAIEAKELIFVLFADKLHSNKGDKYLHRTAFFMDKKGGDEGVMARWYIHGYPIWLSHGVAYNPKEGKRSVPIALEDMTYLSTFGLAKEFVDVPVLPYQ